MNFFVIKHLKLGTAKCHHCHFEENKNLIKKPTKININCCCCCSRIRHWPNQRTNPDYKMKKKIKKSCREEKKLAVIEINDFR